MMEMRKAAVKNCSLSFRRWEWKTYLLLFTSGIKACLDSILKTFTKMFLKEVKIFYPFCIRKLWRQSTR